MKSCIRHTKLTYTLGTEQEFRERRKSNIQLPAAFPPPCLGTFGQWGKGGTGTMGQWDIGAMGQWGNETMGQWDNGAMGQSGNGTMGQWDIGAMGH